MVPAETISGEGILFQAEKARSVERSQPSCAVAQKGAGSMVILQCSPKELGARPSRRSCYGHTGVCPSPSSRRPYCHLQGGKAYPTPTFYGAVWQQRHAGKIQAERSPILQCR